MKHLLAISLVSALIATTAVSCRRTPEGAAHKWASINAEFDSLTNLAERNLFGTFEEKDDVVRLMDSISSLQSGRKALEAQIQKTYWDCYTKICNGSYEEAAIELKRGHQLADSLADEYAQHRFLDIEYIFFNNKDDETLRNLLDNLDYYNKIGDWGQQGNMAMFISNNLQYPDPSIPELSIRYLEMADSLFALAGLDSRREGMRINKLNLMYKLDKMDEAQVEYENLLADAKSTGDLGLQEMLLRNHNYFCNDSASLLEGYELVKSIEQTDTFVIGPAAMRGIYEALLCLYSLKHNDLNGGGYFAALCEKHLGEIYDDDIIITEYEALADYYSLTGNNDKALEYLKKYVETQRRIDEDQNAGEKVYMERLNTMHRHEMEVDAERRMMKQRQMMIILICTAIIIVLLIAVSRWRNRQKLKTLQMKLDAERNERKILAMSMHNEETEKLLDYVRTETERMSHNESINGKDLAQLKTNLKLHIAGKNEMETFEEAFAKVSPEFASRLLAIVPSLTQSNIRLCTYIYMGLTGQEIANLMHITDNGLRVARFRLRQKFGLSKKDSFEEFLRNIANNRPTSASSTRSDEGR